MHVLPSLQVQVQITEAAALPFAAARIRRPRLAYPAQAGNHCAAFRPFLQVFLDGAEDCIGVSPAQRWSFLVKGADSMNSTISVYHIVVYGLPI